MPQTTAPAPGPTDAELLGGAELRYTRRRGFAPWAPQPKKEAVLNQVLAVLDEYRAYQPLTIRQIFYRLVAAHGFEKTEAAYKNQLCEVATLARRAELVPMEAIRDDTVTSLAAPGWDSGEEFLETVRAQAARINLDRTAGQKSRLVVWCEAAGMAPQLARVAHEFGVRVVASGGFDSLTSKYDFAVEVSESERPFEVLHVGDHDASGVSAFINLRDDVTAFADELGGEATFTRLAVTPAQIAEHDLPTAPPKPTDNRAFRGPACQAEALPPDLLSRIVRSAIEARVDRSQLERVLQQEKQTQRELLRRLGNVEG
jgi:hypothetical protein